MEFNEEAFRAKAAESNFSTEQIEAYIAGKKQEAAPIVEQKPIAEEKPADSAFAHAGIPQESLAYLPADGFNEQAFRAKASEQGFSVEQQDAYVRSKSTPIVVDPAYFAKPSLDVPYSLTPSARKRAYGLDGTYRNPVAEYKRMMEGNWYKPQGDDYLKRFEDNIRQKIDDSTVLRIAEQIKADPGTVDGMSAIYSHAEREANWRQDKRELLSNLQELTSVERPFKWMKSTYNSAADAEWRSIKAQNIENIAALAKERGLDLVYQEGQFFAYDDAGNLHKVTPGFLDGIGKSKYEIAGGVAGAVAGSRIPVKHPLAKLAAVITGGIIGTIAGEEIDYLSAAIETQEKLDGQVALEKAIGAAQMGALAEVAGYGIGKMGAGVYRKLQSAYNYILDGNTNGAYAALKDTLGYLSDDEVEELVTRWEKLNEQPAPGRNLKEKAIATLPSTAPGGELLVGAAAHQDPRVALTVRADLNSRAQSVMDMAKNTDSTGEQLQQALADYTKEVKSAYDIVKNASVDIAPANYQFNLINKSLRPALEQTIEEIADPAVVEKLTRLLTKVDEKTSGRTFQDLLDLRELLNEFKYANKVTTKSKYTAAQGVAEAKAEVDAEIAKVMNASDEGKAWLNDWKDVNAAYGEYKQLQKNVLYKAVTKPGATANDIARALINKGPALDDTYAEIISKLPVTVKASVENEIIDQLTQKATLGNTEGFRAVSFPDLAESLKVYDFTSAKAMQLKRAVNDLAEVYRNDRALFSLKAGIQDGVGQSIATTITGKIKMAMVNKAWRRLNEAKGGAQADVTALIAKTAKFLENPLDSKAAEKALKAVGDDMEMQAAIKRLQQAAAEEAASGTGTAKLRVYEAPSGNLTTAGGSRKVLTESIPMHRVMKAEALTDIIGRQISVKADLSKAERTLLANKGILAIVLPNGNVIRID